MSRWVRISLVLGVLMMRASDSYSGTGEQGFNLQGFNLQGFNLQGFNLQGTASQGFNLQGFNLQGFNLQGFNLQGFNLQGFNLQGFNLQGFNLQGFNLQGFNLQGFNLQGFNLQGFNLQGPQLLGIDRARAMAPVADHPGLAYAPVQAAAGTNLQGLLPIPPPTINYVEVPTAPVTRLQFGPTDTTPGNYIFVQGLSNTANDIKGTFWNVALADSSATGGIGVYIADVSKDPATNVSKYASNGDVYLYTVYYRHPTTQQWISLCPVDPGTGKASAMAMPLNPADWTSDASRAKFTFACTATGVAAKCARNWGYKPWLTGSRAPVEKLGGTDVTIPLKPLYDACLTAARAEYCQDGQSYTKNGTMVDLFDQLDPFTSINATAGLPYTPGSGGYMMHEEYQISALDLSTAGTTAPKPFYALNATELMSVPPEDRPALSTLRRSGMQSTRYSDLDPGRQCLAAPYIDRCDPKEPYACYRNTNMSANPYGAFLAVNSPRHCDHADDASGAPLDPLCNMCVTRVCSIDPTCCGDPGNTFYPNSLVWDNRCTNLRAAVCKSGPSDSTWPAGKPAPKPEDRVVTYLRGAVGSFEGFTGSAGARFAEGWACDPDFPGASSFVQISVGGYPGASGATLTTVRADGPLKAEWRDVVATECGGAGRHGFRFALPATADGKDVYVYGIDLQDTHITNAALRTGAPLTLLRGGKKNNLTSIPPQPRSAIWTGWVEAAETSLHTFSVDAGASDKYRVWVNGTYVAGNWVDANPSTPGAFTLAPPATPPQLSLQKGVRYGVRVEYLRASTSDSTSKLTLKWKPAAAPSAAPIPTSALYPAAPGTVNGLVGTFYPTNFSGTPNASKRRCAVDFIWTAGTQPAELCKALPSGISVTSSFAARFEGQVMPPVSGKYLFTADSEAAVSIWVNGQLAHDGAKKPPGAGDPAVCSHDICTTGGAISKGCDQGFLCAAQICTRDPRCCAESWDAQCVQQVSTVCKLDCRKQPPVAIQLLGGVKYDIKVELQHTHDATRPGGAKLQLFWALEGGVRDKVPLQSLFAALDGSAPARGVGLNAAYFNDPTTPFKTEYLNRVDATLAYTASTAPTPLLAAPVTCGLSGVPACDSGDALGAPAIVEPAPSARVAGPSVVVRVRGAAVAATVTLTDKLTVGTTTTTTTYGPYSASDGTVAPTLTLAKGDHSMTVTQTAGGKTGGPGAALAFSVVDPVDGTLPVAPTPTVPPAGLVASNGKVTVGGKATAGATVNVKVGSTTTTFVANGSGDWSGVVTLLSPGVYTLEITQTVGGKTSAPPVTVTAKYAVPNIKVNEPATGEVILTGNSVTVSGYGTPALAGSKVIVGDGDGEYFVERLSLNVGADGFFTGTLSALDPGRHVLSIFQRAGGLDSEKVERYVSVRPALGSVQISSPPANAVVERKIDVAIANVPARTNFDYAVNVFQGNVLLGTATRDPITGAFVLKNVWLTGAGPQQLFVALVASSLSGGGAAESLKSAARNIVVRPDPPVITAPVSGSKQTDLNVVVNGQCATGASVAVKIGTIDRTASCPSGTFTASATVAAGPQLITATQSISGATSLTSVPVLVGVGDITPPKITVNDYTVGTSAPNETGIAYDFFSAAQITATDGGVAVPVTCSPPATPAPFFPLGVTKVSCWAKDAVGNVATTTITVTITSSAAPLIAGTNLVAEATSPAGAAVPYQVSATGFVANCAPPGSTEIVACTGWSPITKGMGFAPTGVAVDPRTGALYGSQPVESDFVTTTNVAGKLVKSTDRGVTWTDLGIPGTTTGVARIGVAPTTPNSTIYVPSSVGLYSFKDNETSATLVLSGMPMRAVSVDPRNALHVLAWNDTPTSGTPADAALFETFDGGKTWRYAADGLPTEHYPSPGDLPYPHITEVAFDPLDAGGRVYAVVEPATFPLNNQPEKIYRRIGSGNWQRLATPPTADSHRDYGPASLAVASTVPSGQARPTVICGGILSKDGGETWAQIPLSGGYGFHNVMFDASSPGRVYGLAPRLRVSTNYGDTWSEPPPVWTSLTRVLQDPTLPATIYLQARASTDIGLPMSELPRMGGLLKSTDSGTSFRAVAAANVAAPIQRIQDLAIDAVNPDTLYLLSSYGFYKSFDGGKAWESRVKGIDEAGGATVPELSFISIDPFNRNVIYLSGKESDLRPAMVTMDAAGDSAVGWANSALTGIVTFDPGKEGVIMASPMSGLPVRRWVNGVDSGGYDVDYQWVSPNQLQVLPDAARTVMVTWNIFDSEGGLYLFSSRDAKVQPALTSVQPAFDSIAARPVFDNSGGTNKLFVSGDAVGSTSKYLYKASLKTPSVWTQVGGGQTGIDFRRLVVDAESGGQVMYAVGANDGLWQSRNGGTTWKEDTTAPTYIRRIWASADGSLYAAVSPTPTTAEDFREMWLYPQHAGGVFEIWKRSVMDPFPPGATVVEGDLRVRCTGLNGKRVARPGSVFPIGSNTMTCKATDAFGNLTTSTFTIQVKDTTGPTITVPASATVSTSGTTAIPVSYVVTAKDAVDEDRPVTCTPASGSSFAVGSTTVTCTSQDTRGNVSTAKFPVVVNRTGSATNPPLLTVPGPMTVEATGSSGAVANPVVTATKSGGGALTPTCTPALNATLALGTTTVSCSVTDAGFTVTKSFTVTVVDTKAPTITVPSPAPNVASQGMWGAAVSFTVTATDLVDGAVTPGCTPGSGSVFAQGTTAVTCIATDKAGNTGIAKFNVVVQDRSPPTLTVPDLVTAEAQDVLGARVTFAVSATDAQDGVRPVDCVPASGSWFPMNETVVSCQTSDTANNVVRDSFVVRVLDTKGPIIYVPSTIAVEATEAGGAKPTFAVTAYDLVSGSRPVTCTRSIGGVSNGSAVTSGSTLFGFGETLVTCTASDLLGNASSTSFKVVVSDGLGPVLTLPGTINATADSTGSAVVTYVASAKDWGNPVPIACSPASGSRFVSGTTLVTCEAYDSIGNKSTGSFNVVVSDSTAPLFSNVPGTIVAYATSTAGATVTYTPPTAHDAADGIRPVTCTPASGATFALNKTTVTCTAKDVANNSVSTTFSVWVQYQVAGSGAGIFQAPLLANGSASIYRSKGSLDVAFALAGASLPITNMTTARLMIAPVTGGVAGTFVNAPPASGTSNAFVYESAGKRYVMKMAIGAMAAGTYRLRADLADGTAVREVDFSILIDTVPPVFSGVPGTITVFATSTSGAPVTYTLPVATDAVDGARTVTCNRASGSTFPINKTTVTCTASDLAGNSASTTFTVWVQYLVATSGGTIFQAPLLANGSALIQRSKGSLPVAFALTGVSLPIANMTTARLTIAPVTGGVAGTFVATTPASGSTGNAFAYDSVNKRYVYNMALAGLADGTFRLRADLADGSAVREIDFRTVMTFAPLTLDTGWTGGAYSTFAPASALADGIVYLRGAMSGTGSGRPFQMPVGQRPSATVTLPIGLCSSVKGTLQIEADGWAYLLGGDASSMSCFVSFEGLSYPVANGSMALTLQTGWTNAGAPWRSATGTISSDIVHLSGAITTNTGSSIAITVPTSMRPAADVYLPINLCSTKKGRLYITTSGQASVYAESGSIVGCAVSLEGVTYAVAPTAANGWTCLTPANGWTAQSYSTRNTCLKNVDGVIRMAGAASTSGTNMNVFTLPAGLRPSKESYVLIDLCAGTTGRIQVSPSGNVNVQSETALSNAQCFSSFEGAAFSL